ncbi:hypothetical protein KAU33_01305 [Candidatus Dependentiae bacterium]|nr:hypothetical protein [Candidatus Dependentiae bacterium]
MAKEGLFKKRMKIYSIFVIMVLCFLTFLLCFEIKVYKGIPMLFTSDDIYIINLLEIRTKSGYSVDIRFAFIEFINY